MKWLAKKYSFFLFTVLLFTPLIHAQNLNRKHLDSLLLKGKNLTVLKEINSLDTLKFKKNDLATLYLYEAKAYTAENKISTAFLSYLKAKRIYLSIDSLDQAMAINLDIAYYLSSTKTNRKKAIHYINEYLKYAIDKNENVLIAKGYTSWATLIMQEQPEESRKLFKKSIYYSEKAQDFNQLESLYSNLGVFYNEILQKPDSAIIYINKSIVYGKKTNNNYGICINLINKASSYYHKKEYKKSIQLLEQAKAITLSEKNKSTESYVYQFLALNYNELGNYAEAYNNLTTYINVQEEFNFNQQNIKISELNIQYQTKEKEVENLKLKAKVERSQIINFSILGIMILGVIFSILIYKNLSKKKKIAEQTQLIQSQRLEKTLKDREIHDIDLMLKSQEIERQQIANELHDNLGSLLATLKLNFQNLNRLKNADNTKLFEKTDALLEETYQKVRNIAHLKNMGVIGNEGLVVAVKKMAEKMTVINRLQINVFPYGLTQRLSNTTEVTLFRIIQELCTNIIKHSQAKEVNIYLTQHNSELINIIIEDNGKGFDYKNVTKKDGIGLKSIAQKVEQMGGTFTVDSIVSKGTTIIIDLPL